MTSDSWTTRAPRPAATSAVPSADAASITSTSSIRPSARSGSSASMIVPTVAATSRHGSTTETVCVLASASARGSKREATKFLRSAQSSMRRSADRPWRARPSVRPEVVTRTARDRVIGTPRSVSVRSSAWSSSAAIGRRPPARR